MDAPPPIPPPPPGPAVPAPASGQEYLYPAFMAAICAGALAGVPVLNIGCCLWMVGGGILAVYFFEQKHGRPLTRLGDGSRLGTMTGFFGFFLAFFINLFSQILIFRGLGGMFDAYRRQLERYPWPPGPQAAETKAWALSSTGMAFFFIFGAILFFFAFVILSTLGGVIGVKAFRKKD
jgi:hypothetical protein